MSKEKIVSPVVSPYQEIPEEGIGRFSKADILLLRRLDDPIILKTARKAILQLDLTPDEVELLKSSFAGDILTAFSNLFVPQGEDVALIGGTRWADRKYADLLSSEAKVLVLSRQDSIKAVEAGLKRLANIVIEGNADKIATSIDIEMSGSYEDKSPEDVKRAVVAFQDTMIFLEICFNQIKGFNVRENKKEDSNR